MAIRFGVFVPQGWKMDLNAIDDPIEQFETMTGVAKEVDEKTSFDSIWVYDHFHTVPEPTMNTTFECWTITATLARDTKRVNVGQMVSCNGYRNPALFAKIASTVDVASHGRLYAGLGAGWYEHEWRAYGYGFPEVPERMGMFREAVQIVHKMWTEDKPTFSGKRYSIDAPINEPKNSGKGKVPLWIGGGGEKVTLKLVAQYADACNVGGGNPETIRHKLDVLRQHCENVGRDYNEITKSTTYEVYPIAPGADPVQATAKDREARGGMSYEAFAEKWRVGTPEQLAEQIQAGVDAGANYIINYIPGIAYDSDLIHRYNEEIIPLIKG